MNGKTRLKELAAFSEAANNGTLKELGIFTRERPQFDDKGNFVGMTREANPMGIAATAVGAGALGYGGYRGHKYIMDNYGKIPVLRYNQWDWPHRPGTSTAPVGAGIGHAYRSAFRDLTGKATDSWNQTATKAAFKTRKTPWLSELFKAMKIK